MFRLDKECLEEPGTAQQMKAAPSKQKESLLVPETELICTTRYGGTIGFKYVDYRYGYPILKKLGHEKSVQSFI
jgi:hypothetical protein